MHVAPLLRLAASAVLLACLTMAPLRAQQKIVFEKDIEYANPDNQHLQLNMARPAQGSGPFPAVLCIHGGGFRAGTRDGYDGLIRSLAERGYVAVTVTYRLAPKYPFPAAIHDVKAAVRWLRGNAGKYHLAPDRIGVTGGSAGGHLAQFLGVTGDVKEFEGSEGHLNQSSRVTCVVNYFGPSDFTQSYGKSVDAAEVLPLFLGGNLEQARQKHILASPLYWVTPHAAPTLCVHGTKDNYVAHEQAVWLVDKLKAAGVEAELLTLEGAGHGFAGEYAQQADAALFAFFDKHLKPVASPLPTVRAVIETAQEPYRKYADSCVAALQAWYDPAAGTWNTTGWWNSANALEAVIDYSAKTRSKAYLPAIAATFEKHRAGRFLNHYYDDEGWWALTWIKAYDLTKEARYLDMAKTIFDDMKGGWDETHGGGIWWSKDRKYKNAIANELFLTLAARLHQRTPSDKGEGSYLEWAQREWTWFEAGGMINPQKLINDGLNAEGRNNGGTAWTYNQGVILGGLIALYEITRQKSYLAQAQAIADAAIGTLVNSDGILVEPCEKDSDCGGDGPQFKGIFMRNLSLLAAKTKQKAYWEFLQRNAVSLWEHNRNETNQFGLRWAGPFDRANAARQSAALDAFNAALN